LTVINQTQKSHPASNCPNFQKHTHSMRRDQLSVLQTLPYNYGCFNPEHISLSTTKYFTKQRYEEIIFRYLTVNPSKNICDERR
jgi:hypothetical protein